MPGAQQPQTRGEELVVLLDDDVRPAGSLSKEQVHGTGTPLHLASPATSSTSTAGCC